MGLRWRSPCGPLRVRGEYRGPIPHPIARAYGGATQTAGSPSGSRAYTVADARASGGRSSRFRAARLTPGGAFEPGARIRTADPSRNRTDCASYALTITTVFGWAP